tara:strand:+ start:678 stop:1115 length:438 start_codon:yes stop_codon:yes gene_type:complete
MLYFFGFLFLGLLYGNFLEYVIHKHLFHKMGRKKNSIWGYHLRGHHVLSKKNGFIDLTASQVENWGLIFLMVVHLPFFWLSIGFWLGINIYSILFKVLHGFQHSHPEFTKKYMKWHWDHHMKNPNKNFGVVAPWSDYLFRTRKDH